MLERSSKLTSYRFDQLADQINQRVMPAEADVERYVGLKHLDPDSLRIRRWGDPSEVESTKLRFEPGDIIFGKRRVYQRKVAVADTDGICSAHAMVLRAKPDTALPEFLPFFMQSDLFMERALSISVGSLSPTINWKALAKEEFLLPPIQEQARLVKTLSTIDATFEHYGNLIEASRILQSSWLDSKFQTLLTQHSEKPLKDVCTKITDGAHKTPTYVSEGVPFLRVTDIQSEVVDWDTVKRIPESEHVELCKRCRPEVGDVLLSKNGTIGVSKVIDWHQEFSIFVSLCLLKPSDEIESEYLRMMLNSSQA